MAWLGAVVVVTASCFVTPFLMFMLCIIFLASIGKSLGVRRLYVKLLLTIFEYGRIEVAQNSKRAIIDTSSPDDAPNDESLPADQSGLVPNATSDMAAGKPVAKQPNGVVPSEQTNGNSVISRDKLILVPDPSLLNGNGQNSYVKRKEDGDVEDEGESETVEKILERGFPLSDCLDYVKAGVEAIIEDQVTSRFEAEELKNWNLLTRTNMNYEFISWKLTVLWMCGFFVRYFFLFPLRVLICFFGIVWYIAATYLIGFLPESDLKVRAHRRMYMVGNRIMCRSLSFVATFHNVEHRPKNGGVCVANHTSPIDIYVLSTENCFCLVMWLTLCTALVGYVPDGAFKSWLNRKVSVMCFGVLSSALSSVITYHNRRNVPKNGICVANHTSPIDVLVLMCDHCYSLIGQRHGGFLGVLQRALARASPHIWFERSEIKDRHAVAHRLKNHVSNPSNPPILIFPEGTCINNTSVMQFKKGSFEVGSVIYPVAIKYDPRFGDPFWNSSRYSMMQYMYLMMTSWAIVCDVWYLPPMYQQDGETAIDFANRVKGVIAKQGGLVDLMWDGQLKRMKPKKEWKERQQEEFSKLLKVD